MGSVSGCSLDKGDGRKKLVLFACLPLCLVGELIYPVAAVAAAVITDLRTRLFGDSNVALQESSESFASNGDC